MAVVKHIFSYLWNHKKISAGLLILVVIVAFLFRPKPPVVVPTQTISRGEFIQSIAVSGSVAAENTANLTFPMGGKVVYIGAKEGDSVKQYQTIASLDERTLEATLESDAKAAQNQQISFDTVNDKNGDRSLSDTGLSVAAQRELQTAMNTLDQAQLTVEIQKIAQEQAVLISPINGILTRADIQDPGITASLSTTYTVVDPTSTVFDMDVDEADIGNVKAGQEVQIVFDAYPNETITEPITKIDFVSHTTSNGSNAYTVETSLPSNISYKYRVGMNANATIILSKKENVLSVPIASIGNNNTVWVKTKGGFTPKQVQFGAQNDTDAEVLSGVSAGDQVAIDPTAAAAQAVKKQTGPFGL
ncbi:MAG TPA: efflux RND transporter periplasmic adaptor subunit [Candidatus Saccharimonadales bacterium]|nr:efflux RND transporter periplasmic adaptor subunit [Candidatus Saccharimonadales bacterium]